MAKTKRFQWEEDPLDLALEIKPSRSAKKREALALQELGAKLLKLDYGTLSELNLTKSLEDALKEYPRLNTHEAKRRQMQYIGRLMREQTSETLESLKLLF